MSSDPLRALRAVGGKLASSGGLKLPNIPAVPMTADAGVANFLGSVKSWLEKAMGSGLSGFATRRDLIDTGVITIDDDGSTYYPLVPDAAIPPIPTGLSASGAMTTIILQWDDPAKAYGNHGYTEVWSAQADNFTQAVLIGQSLGFMYNHAVGQGAKRFYWIRFVSSTGVKGPYQGVAGVRGETSPDPAYLLDLLEGELSESQLVKDLNERIDLIDKSDIDKAQANGGIMQEIRHQGADITNLQVQVSMLSNPEFDANYTGGYSIGNVVAFDGKLWKCIKATGEAPIVPPAENTFWTKVSDYVDWTAAISAENKTRATADSALAKSVTTLQTTVGNHTTSIRTQQESIDGISAKYSVKIDANGYVSGFGLISEANDGVPRSEFAIVADKFSIAPVATEHGAADGSPFFYLTRPTVISGVEVPAGAYMKSAFICDAAITNAKIANLAVDTAKIADMAITDAKINNLDASKIDTGYLSAKRILAYSITADKIDSRGLTIKDDKGNILFGAGTPISVLNISGLGTMATRNEVTAAEVAGLGPMALKETVNWQTDLVNIPVFGRFAWLSTITAANVSTFIESAAIGTAHIANAAITTLKVATGAITFNLYSDFSGRQYLVKGSQTDVGGVVFNVDADAGSNTIVELRWWLGLGTDKKAYSWPVTVRIYRDSTMLREFSGSVGHFMEGQVVSTSNSQGFLVGSVKDGGSSDAGYTPVPVVSEIIPVDMVLSGGAGDGSRTVMDYNCPPGWHRYWIWVAINSIFKGDPAIYVQTRKMWVRFTRR